MFKLIASIALALGMATTAMAGDFSTSGVTYTTPDFTTAGGTRTVSGFDSTFTRFPLVAGESYTISWASTNGTSFGMRAYDFVAPEAAGGDPFGSSGIIASAGFSTAGTLTFVAATDGFGTIELTDFFSSPVAATITLVTTATPVPLPAAGLLLLGGLAAFGAVKRRKKPAQLA